MIPDTINFKAGFVAVLGKPNVGKSTLVNMLLGHKVAAVSPRPQTTRRRQMGILTRIENGEGAQIIFVDTPGIHHPRYKLGELMNKEAEKSLEESDAILLVVDASQPPDDEDLMLFELLEKVNRNKPVVLALNKVDLIDEETLSIRQNQFTERVPRADVVAISATQPRNLPSLLEILITQIPPGEPFFPDDQITDLLEREIAADLIREAALIILRDEIPHGIAIRIDQYQEREEHGAYIEATLFVERESHKPIVIGKGGNMLKAIGSSARKEIESMTGRKIFLNLKVKVRKNWRNDENVLRRFGY